METEMQNSQVTNASCVKNARRSFYLSNSGDDDGPGTRRFPWKTIDRANKAKLCSNVSIFFRAGDTFSGNLAIEADESAESAGTPNSVIISTYQRRDCPRRTVIDGGDGTAISLTSVGGIAVRNLTLRGNRQTNKGFGIEVVNKTKDRLNFVSLDKLDVHGFKWVGIYVGGTYFLPGEPRPTVNPPRYGFANVRISRCKAHHNTYYGILTSGPWQSEIPSDPNEMAVNPGYANADVRIIDCRAYENPGDPNYTENHSGTGILIDDTDEGAIRFCKAWLNGAENGSQSGGPVGIWANQSNRIMIEWNEMFHNRTGGLADGAGCDLDGGVTNSVVRYNYTYGNDGAGILVWSYWGTLRQLKGNTICHNLSIDDGRKFKYGGVHIGNSGSPVADIDVYNNVIMMRKRRDLNAGAEPLVAWVGGHNPNSNISFRDNVFIAGRGVPLVEVEPNSQASFAQNDYVAARNDFQVTYQGKTYHSLTEWRAAMPQEKDEREVHGMMFHSPREWRTARRQARRQ
jgi:hypothetical protein